MTIAIPFSANTEVKNDWLNNNLLRARAAEILIDRRAFNVSEYAVTLRTIRNIIN